jgi:tyrosyl-tRNA synthetase
VSEPIDPRVADQVDAIFLGAEFGDDTLEDAMRRELTDRLVESQRTGAALRVYTGYDPTRPDLHLGHSITIRKMRLFQDFGHDVFFLVGTFTAQVGDASDKAKERPRISAEQVRAAAATYAEQAFAILDPERTTVVYNDEWLGQLALPDVIEIASAFTVQQFLARESFRRRIDAGDPIRLHEFLYALLQGYDAVHLRADVQLGATEQLFNILAGRHLQERAGQRGCTAITFPVLVGTDGKARMSKSAGNYVGLKEPPVDQFGKVMSIDDDTMRQWARLISSWSPNEVREKLAALDRGDLHPMELKKQLAADVVTMYHGADAAADAHAHFETVHQRREYDDADAARPLTTSAGSLLEALLEIPRVASKREARRLLAQSSVYVNGASVSDEQHPVREGDLLRVGKRDLFRVQRPD